MCAHLAEECSAGRCGKCHRKVGLGPSVVSCCCPTRTRTEARHTTTRTRTGAKAQPRHSDHRAPPAGIGTIRVLQVPESVEKGSLLQSR